VAARNNGAALQHHVQHQGCLAAPGEAEHAAQADDAQRTAQHERPRDIATVRGVAIFFFISGSYICVHSSDCGKSGRARGKSLAHPQSAAVPGPPAREDGAPTPVCLLRAYVPAAPPRQRLPNVGVVVIEPT
jgi:hypothetical protein